MRLKSDGGNDYIPFCTITSQYDTISNNKKGEEIQ